MFVTQKKLVCGERKNYWKMNIVGIYGETTKNLPPFITWKDIYDPFSMGMGFQLSHGNLI